MGIFRVRIWSLPIVWRRPSSGRFAATFSPQAGRRGAHRLPPEAKPLWFDFAFLWRLPASSEHPVQEPSRPRGLAAPEAFAIEPEAAAFGILGAEIVARRRVGAPPPGRRRCAPVPRWRRRRAERAASGSAAAARRAPRPAPRSARAARTAAMAAPARPPLLMASVLRSSHGDRPPRARPAPPGGAARPARADARRRARAASPRAAPAARSGGR